MESPFFCRKLQPVNANATRILFIINPISGGHNKAEIIKAIPKLLDTTKFDISFAHTKRAGHAVKIAKKAVENNMAIVVAVGGDGTINEVASQLVNTNTALAIVPCGSGNGLARELGIPLHYKKAIQQINTLNIIKIDIGICNNLYFFNLFGLGFDGKVAYDFNRGKKRKFLGYAWAILKDYFNVQNQYFEIELENEKIADSFFFVTIANGAQWGYNVKAAPNAQLNDGVFAVNLCKKPSFFSLIPFGIKLLSGKIGTSKYVIIKDTSQVSVSSNKKFFYHLDGDAKGVAKNIKADILPEALRIITR